MPRIKLQLSIGFAGAVRKDEEDIDDDLWDSMDEKEREAYLDDIATDWANNYIDYSAELMD